MCICTYIGPAPISRGARTAGWRAAPHPSQVFDSAGTNLIVRVAEKTFRTNVFGMLLGTRTNVSWANRTVDILSGPARRRSAPTRP